VSLAGNGQAKRPGAAALSALRGGLNPVELLWSNLKYGRLANFAPNTTDEAETSVDRERQRHARDPELRRSFLRCLALPIHV